MSGRVQIIWDLGWGGRRIYVLLVLCMAGAAGLLGRHLAGRSASTDTAAPQRAGEAMQCVDPNTATYAELRCLPRIGPSRASAILNYRRKHGPRPFLKADDLQKVHGIGPGTIRSIRALLRFDTPSSDQEPTRGPATRP